MVYGGVAETILIDILRIPAVMITGNFLKDIVNLIIFPSIVLIIFLNFVSTLFLRGHSWMKNIFTMALFLVIVVNGWYGPFAAFASNYVILFLIVAGILFFVSRFLPHEKEHIKSLGKHTFFGKMKVIRDLEIERRAVIDSLRLVESELSNLNSKIARGVVTEDERQRVKQLSEEKSRLIQRKIEIETELKKLKKIL